MRALRLVLMSFLCLSCTPPAPVDRLFVGGIVHLPDRPPQQREVAVADGRIVALVAPEEAPSWRRRAREVVPIPQAHVYPGFTESHGHLTGFGAALETVDLTGAGSYQEVIQRLAAKAHQLPPGSWVLGRGWDQNLWEGKAFPHHRELSQAIPHHPVLARRVDGHALLVNEHALQLAGITAQTQDPPGGQILRDAQGQPTGVLVDAAGDLVERVLPPPSVEELQRRQLAAAHRLASFGITSIHDAGTTARELEALRLLAGLGQLPIRVYVMLDGSDEQLLTQELARGVQTAPDGMLTVRAVKLYADGALGSRGAWLSQPYEDAPGQVGLSLTPLQRLRDVVARAAAAGFQPCIHAIGDEAVHQVLNLYEELLAGRAASLRPRVEHAQVVRPEDVPRFAQLQVIASVQPTPAPPICLGRQSAWDLCGSPGLTGGGRWWMPVLAFAWVPMCQWNIPTHVWGFGPPSPAKPPRGILPRGGIRRSASPLGKRWPGSPSGPPMPPLRKRCGGVLPRGCGLI
ncbi:MAG: amidohydrolase [Thermoanaerobaculum sp.]|nr:amidohydrolase [Thermoanaerobaculum sp.]